MVLTLISQCTREWLRKKGVVKREKGVVNRERGEVKREKRAVCGIFEKYLNIYEIIKASIFG